MKKESSSRKIVKQIVSLLLISLASAVSYYTFVTPNHFAPGGIYGLGNMIQNKTVGLFDALPNGIPWAVPVLIISIPLIIMAFKVLDKRAALAIAGMALFTNLFDILLELIHFPQLDASQGNDALDYIFVAIASGSISGMAIAYATKIFGTCDGTTALGAIIKKRHPEQNIAWLTFMMDAVVVFASLFVYWNDNTAGVEGGLAAKFLSALRPVMYSIVNLFVVSKVWDVFLRGFNIAYKYEIITIHPEEISREIIDRLDRSVTRISSRGMYSGSEKALLICIVTKKQIGELERIIRQYPDTFGYVSSANEVMGDFSR